MPCVLAPSRGEQGEHDEMGTASCGVKSGLSQRKLLLPSARFVAVAHCSGASHAVLLRISMPAH